MSPLSNPDIHYSWMASLPFIGMAVNGTPKLPTMITRLLEVAIVAAAVLVFNTYKDVEKQKIVVEHLTSTVQETKRDVKDLRILLEAFIKQQ